MTFRHRRTSRLIAALIVPLLVASILALPGPALAAARLHPALFAMSAAAFPPGSQVVRAGVENNRLLLRDDPLHFGIPAVATRRLTGYYMDAVEGDQISASHPFTSYLVSIFPSAHLARIAFDIRFQSWFVIDYYTSPQSAPIKVGSGGYVALYRSFNPTYPPLTELFFVRGSILAEVFQATGDRPATAAELQSLYTIAEALDRLAQLHPAGS